MGGSGDPRIRGGRLGVGSHRDRERRARRRIDPARRRDAVVTAVRSRARKVWRVMRPTRAEVVCQATGAAVAVATYHDGRAALLAVARTLGRVL